MAVTFAPASLSFSTPGYKAQTLSISVTNTGTVSVSVAVSGDGDFTMATATVAAGATSSLSVVYRPTKTAGGTGTLTATAAGSQTALGTASLAGTATNPLTIAAATEFGSTTVGGSVLRLVLASNTSDTNATLGGVTSPPFVLSDAYTTVAAAAYLTVPITYAPSVVGETQQTATLTVGPWSVTGTLHGACVDATTEVESTTVTTTADDGTTSTATAQSYYINIPNPPTSFNLGYKREATLKVNGVAIDTVGCAYLHTTDDIGIIAAGKDGSKSTGSIFTQSAVDTIVIADGDILASSTGAGAWLVGKAGVAIGTMSSSRTSDADSLMPTDDGVKSTKLDLNIAATMFLSLDALIAFATMGVTTWSEVTSAKMFGGNLWKPKYMISKFITVTAALAAVTLDIVNTVSAVTTSIDPASGTPGAPGITLYAHAGILAGTPGFASFYAGAGLVIGSAYPTMIGMDTAVLAMKDLSLLAMFEATLSGKSATVHGSKEVRIESSEVIELRTRKVDAATVSPNAGTVEIKPTKIEAWVTDHADTKGKISKYEISETKVETSVKDHTDDKSELKMVPKKIELTSANKTASEKVLLELTPKKIELSTKDATGASTLDMTPTTVTLDAGQAGTIILKAGGWQIEISSEGIQLTKGGSTTAGPALLLTPDGATMAKGMATYVELADEGVTIKGDLINNG